MTPEDGYARDLSPTPLPRRHGIADLLVGLACPECHGPLIPNNILNMLLMGLLVTQSQGAPSLLCENCRPHRQYQFIFNEIPDFRPKNFGKEAPVENYQVSLPAPPAWLVKMKMVLAWPLWVLIMAILALHPKRTNFRKTE